MLRDADLKPLKAVPIKVLSGVYEPQDWSTTEQGFARIGQPLGLAVAQMKWGPFSRWTNSCGRNDSVGHLARWAGRKPAP